MSLSKFFFIRKIEELGKADEEEFGNIKYRRATDFASIMVNRYLHYLVAGIMRPNHEFGRKK